MRNPLKPREIARYIPQECQVHTCPNPAVAFCGRMYIFVCDEHIKQYCIPDKHRLHPIAEALELCAVEAENNAISSRKSAERYEQEAIKYRKQAEQLKAGRIGPWERGK